MTPPLSPSDAVPVYLAGAWHPTGTVLEVRTPWDDAPVGRVHLAGAPEFEAALAAARAARGTLLELPAHRRAAALDAVSRALHADREGFARSITLEMGKTIRESRGEVDRAVQTFRIAAEEAGRLGGEIMDLGAAPGHEGRLALVRRFPRGIVVGISPYNFPLNLVAHKIAPAIACGAPIILKPASKTPLTALRLARLIDATGLPDGALSVLPARGSDAERLAVDARVAVVTFTGSAAIGWALRAKAARAEVTLELGGNAAAVVEPDADLDAAAARLVTGAFALAGQSCISVQRIYAEATVHDALVERLARGARGLAAGNPLDEATDLGPVVDEENAERITTWIDAARRAGARVVTGGGRSGRLVEATILTGVPEDASVCCDEVFGPVAVVAPYRGFDEALRRVNASRYGLQAGVFTNDIGKALRAHRELEVGGVVVNDIPSYRADAMPYGGAKDSGTGREGPRWAIEEMTEPRVLVLRNA